MKKQFFIAVLLISGTFAASAQSNNDNKPTKGYYSIGKNAEKTKKAPSEGITIKRSATAPSVQKGYYSIGTNNRKLQKPITIVSTSTPAAPSKGYYGIGNNAEKLKQ
ncbi:hypothetical protein [Parasegetibacter sp. NRK P23]|uniref:hypothetical protein n=1 Tax=Parasegetibacter sp. NRK P23 TaxID=2942999 RepID=UPI002043FC02|nr:hypothetical protein [Parasegetibacter sp. NRK P23]MCM5530397.1 hypothetical protein [Parasegetibacter sp. NRK P23]